MGLVSSLLAKLFGGPRAPAEQEQPSELTAVSPDFTGFVSNRPSETAGTASAAAPSARPPVAPQPEQPASGAAPVAAGANEFTAVAPEFSGRVSNRPLTGDDPGAP